jgi:hypothetical protein
VANVGLAIPSRPASPASVPASALPLEERDWLNLSQATLLMGVQRGTITAWHGLLPSTRDGRYSRADLIAVLRHRVRTGRRGISYTKTRAALVAATSIYG